VPEKKATGQRKKPERGIREDQFKTKAIINIQSERKKTPAGETGAGVGCGREGNARS